MGKTPGNRIEPAMEPVHELMEQAVGHEVFPGGVLVVSIGPDLVFRRAYGKTRLPSGKDVTPKTIFDLASLTKPLATTLAAMILVQEEKLDLDLPAVSVLPLLKRPDKKEIRISHLLRHTSGFPDWRPYFRQLEKFPPAKRRSALHGLLAAEPILGLPGERMVYSDPGFMVLQWVVEEASGVCLDRFVRERIYGPLGLDGLFFIRHGCGRPPGDYAATELCPWRKTIMEGAVHDENAYGMGGVAGHAGLFGRADDVQSLLAELLAVYKGDRAKGLFRRDLLSRIFSREAESGRGLGFDMPSACGSSAGSFFSQNSVGHLGFTGTSFWVDLDRSVIVVLLTNRVHPSRENTDIRSFRPRLHDAVMSSLLSP